VNGSDSSRRSKCDTADGSSGVIVNCVIVRASGINSLDLRRSDVICHVTYTQHVTICYLSLCHDFSLHFGDCVQNYDIENSDKGQQNEM
jgi:hypothetical protein